MANEQYVDDLRCQRIPKFHHGQPGTVYHVQLPGALPHPYYFDRFQHSERCGVHGRGESAQFMGQNVRFRRHGRVRDYRLDPQCHLYGYLYLLRSAGESAWFYCIVGDLV